MSARQVIFHIGFPKCASSSIQAFFATNARRNRGQGLYYPSSGRSRGGYRSHAPLFRAARDGAELRGIMDDIQSETGQARTILLSSEAGVGRLNENGMLRRCTDELSRRFGVENVTVLVVIRNHFEFAHSVYAQFIRAGLYGVDRRRFFRRQSGTIARYYRLLHARDGTYPFSYRDTLAVVGDQIGECRLKIVSMHRSDLGGDVVAHLAAEAGCLDAQDYLVRPRNARFSARALLAMSDAYKRHPVGLVEERGERIARYFDRPEDHGRSFDLHGGRNFHEIIRRCQQRDSDFLAAQLGCFDAVLAAPEYRPPETQITLSTEDRHIVDLLLKKSPVQRLVPSVLRNAAREIRTRWTGG